MLEATALDVLLVLLDRGGNEVERAVGVGGDGVGRAVGVEATVLDVLLV